MTALLLIMFFFGIIILTLMLRQKRKVGAAGAFSVALLAYMLFQWRMMDFRFTADESVSWQFACISLALLLLEIFLFIAILRGRHRITPMSIKEATDSLPMGIMCCAPNGKILLVNAMMEHICLLLTGELPANGATFSQKLHESVFLPGCEPHVGEAKPMIHLSDGTTWTIAEEDMTCDGVPVHAFMVSDISDIYQKTIELDKIREQMQWANERLTKINQEIIALTAEKELLDAKVKIHDEMGANLLAIKRFILHGGTEAERAEIAQRVRENIDFLREKPDEERDEYELMIDAAEKLGVHVVIVGTLPQAPGLKKILSTAIHECFTNILRHAHGDRLQVDISEHERSIVARFAGNGAPPKGQIVERGGLALLRTLTEQAGGRMTVCSERGVVITLELPKEGEYEVSGIDRG